MSMMTLILRALCEHSEARAWLRGRYSDLPVSNLNRGL